jgi:hypothetical protein
MATRFVIALPDFGAACHSSVKSIPERQFGQRGGSSNDMIN